MTPRQKAALKRVEEFVRRDTRPWAFQQTRIIPNWSESLGVCELRRSDLVTLVNALKGGKGRWSP